MRRPILAVVAALSLAGCGELREPVVPLGELDPTVAVEYALRKTIEAGSAAVTFEMTASMGDRTIRFHGDAEMEFEPPAQHMTFEIPRLGPGSPAGEMEMVLVDLVMYMRSPALGTAVAAPTPWIALDLRRLARGSDRLVAMLERQSDPALMLNLLHGVIEARALGPETLTGVVATRYEVTIDLARLLRRLPRGTRAMSKASLAGLKALGLESLTFDVWIDRDGYVRRELVDLPVPGSPGDRLEMVVDLGGFGLDYDIRPPPPSKVTDVADLRAGSRGP